MKKTICIILAALMLGGVIGYGVSRHPFTDVPADSYYADAVQWAYDSGITRGTDATHFEPERPITRAEFVTMLWRMNGNSPEETDTPKPRTISDMPYQPPAPSLTIHPEYQLAYIGRLYIGEVYSVGLYDTLDQELVDLKDAAFVMKRAGGCYMIGDHDAEGFWIIRWCGDGDTLRIEKKDGTVEVYEWMRADPDGTNVGYDVLGSDGTSCFTAGYDLFLATCNDSEGRSVTVTFWNRRDEDALP